mmetsp:Transcript_93599/g.291432  ORF Transcript_93599/g.291432 Transcript_93599/m.291432 type:complete len:105 (-) Transcript_93599:53-367(-)
MPMRTPQDVPMEIIVAVQPGRQSPATRPSDITMALANPMIDCPGLPGAAAAATGEEGASNGLSCQRTRKVSKGLQVPVARAAAVPAQALFLRSCICVLRWAWDI